MTLTTGSSIADRLPSAQPLSEEDYPLWKWWDEDRQRWTIKLRITEQDWVDYHKWKADNGS